MIDICVCISTRNRKQQFLKCLSSWTFYLPENAQLIVIDDASEPTYCNPTYRFDKREGIPAVKNRCLFEAMKTTARHFFLFDDDCYATTKDWHLPYIQSPYGHLSFTFTNAYQNMPAKKPGYVKDGHVWHSLSNGCMIYVTREVVNRVGGFRTEYGLGTYDHIDYSNRVKAAGLIPHAFMDVIGSDKLLYSMDANNEVARSFTDQERAQLIQRNYPIFASKRFDTNFVPYDTHR